MGVTIVLKSHTDIQFEVITFIESKLIEKIRNLITAETNTSELAPQSFATALEAKINSDDIKVLLNRENNLVWLRKVKPLYFLYINFYPLIQRADHNPTLKENQNAFGKTIGETIESLDGPTF